MSRQPGAFLAVLAFSTIAAGSANAKECKADSDCATGFECVLRYVDGASGSGGSTGTSTGGSAGTGATVGTACVGPDCPVSSPTPEIDVPSTQPADRGGTGPIPPLDTTGICQWKTVICSSKADCPANLDCVKQTVVTPRPTCPPDTKCDVAVPPTSETGLCKAVCEVDSDCPSPLVCKLQGQICMGGGSARSDGTVTTIPTTCTGGHKICTFEPVVCSSDTMCNDANYQCAKVSEYQSCTGSAPVCPRTKDGTEPACTPTDPEPPVCTSTVVNNCAPKEFKCDAGQACPAGWSCFDFTNFETMTIPGWSGSGYGKACLPDGIVLGIYGYTAGSGVRNSTGYGSDSQGGVDLGGAGSGDKGGTSAPVTTGDGTTPPRTGPVPASDGQESAPAGENGDANSTTVRGGGCAMGGTHGGSFDLWLTLGLAGLVLRLVRRRR